MKKKFSVLFVISLVIIITGCTALLTFDTNPLKKNMPMNEVRTTLSKNIPPLKTLTIKEIPNQNIIVDIYMMYNGEIRSYYFVAYADEKLLYWGYPYEFNRHKEELINKIGELAWQKYEAIK